MLRSNVIPADYKWVKNTVLSSLSLTAICLCRAIVERPPECLDLIGRNEAFTFEIMVISSSEICNYSLKNRPLGLKTISQIYYTPLIWIKMAFYGLYGGCVLERSMTIMHKTPLFCYHTSLMVAVTAKHRNQLVLVAPYGDDSKCFSVSWIRLHHIIVMFLCWDLSWIRITRTDLT